MPPKDDWTFYYDTDNEECWRRYEDEPKALVYADDRDALLDLFGFDDYDPDPHGDLSKFKGVEVSY